MTTSATSTSGPSGRRNVGPYAVFPIGLGGMYMSITDRPDEAQAIAAIHAALDAGVDFIDTADVYCLNDRDIGHNERLVAKALNGRSEKAIAPRGARRYTTTCFPAANRLRLRWRTCC